MQEQIDRYKASDEVKQAADGSYTASAPTPTPAPPPVESLELEKQAMQAKLLQDQMARYKALEPQAMEQAKQLVERAGQATKDDPASPFG